MFYSGGGVAIFSIAVFWRGNFVLWGACCFLKVEFVRLMVLIVFGARVFFDCSSRCFGVALCVAFVPLDTYQLVVIFFCCPFVYLDFNFSAKNGNLHS
jgi:hypothetical protein